MIFSPVSKPASDKSIFVTRFILLTGGLDMPFATNAQGYSTTEFLHEFVSAISMAFNIALALFTVS